MYWAAGVVAVIYVALGIWSRKESAEDVEQKALVPFSRMALRLYKCTFIRRLPMFSDRQVARDLERLHPGESGERLCTAYYVKKLSVSLLLLFLGTVFGVAFSAKTKGERLLNDAGEVVRGDYLQEGKDFDVSVSLEEQVQTFRVHVNPRKLTGEQAQELYQSFWREITALAPGRNSSLDQVTEELVLAEGLKDYPFTVEWSSDRPDLVDRSGRVAEVDDREEVCLKAVISYEDMEWQEELKVCVMPPLLSWEEELHRELEELLAASEQADREQEIWRLPDRMDGRQLVWNQDTKDSSLQLWGAALAVTVLIFFLADKDLHDKLEERKRQMKGDYPDIVQKLALYLGAGMTVRGAFHKISGDHGQKEGGRKKEGLIYEEMRYTCRELQAGISEGAAYECFGRRTGLQEYIRLSTLLQQNLKKGNGTLLIRLREEADKSSQERLQSARRLGEEAMTKMLVPMVMTLLVVMVIIMIPAFSSSIMG